MSALTAPFSRLRPPSPGGMTLVFRHHLLLRSAWRDLGCTAGLLAVLLVISAQLQRLWLNTDDYVGSEMNFLARWLTTSALAAIFLLLPCAAVLGAGAVPTRAEFEKTQSALLTRLTAFDIIAGRLLASLWPLISTLLASLAFWLCAQLGWHFLEGPRKGFLLVFLAHTVLLCAVFMVGAVGFLCAVRRRPGRNWSRGALAGLLWVALCIGGIFAIDPLFRRMNNPTPLINAALLFNPATAVVTAFGALFDPLKYAWIYNHTTVNEYEHAYPPSLVSTGVFLAIGLLAMGLAAWRMRRAYR